MQNGNDPNQGKQDKTFSFREIWHELAPVIEVVIICLGILTFLGIAYILQRSTADMAKMFKVNGELADLIGWGVALTFVVHCVLAAASGNHVSKFLNGVFAFVWVVIGIILAVTSNVMLQVGITAADSFSDMQAKLTAAGVVVSPEILMLGQLAFDALIGLMMLSLSVGIWGALGMGRKVIDPHHSTLGHVLMSVGVTVVLVGAAIGSGVGMFQFGMLTGVDIFRAAMTSFLSEVTFLAALKRGNDTGRGYYIVLAVAAIGYALLVNWLYGRVLLNGLSYIQTDATARMAADLYSMAGPLFAAAWGVMEFITVRHNQMPQRVNRPDVVQPSWMHRTAKRITETREGGRAIRDAWRGQRSQLTAPPEVIVVSKDEPIDGQVRIVKRDEDQGKVDPK